MDAPTYFNEIFGLTPSTNEEHRPMDAPATNKYVNVTCPTCARPFAAHFPAFRIGRMVFCPSCFTLHDVRAVDPRMAFSAMAEAAAC